jgi:cysteine sulfinate desulfinase/cysteine desulfurase-like protein
MNVTKDFIDGAIRVSLGLSTTKEDIDYFIKIFSQFYSHNFKH